MTNLPPACGLRPWIDVTFVDPQRFRRRPASPGPGRRGPTVGSVAPPARRTRSGIGDLPDLDGPKSPRNRYPTVAARPGLVVKQRGTPITGVVLGVVNGALSVKDRQGFEHRMRLQPGGFEVDGQVVTLVEPAVRRRGPRPPRPVGRRRGRSPCRARRRRWRRPAGSSSRASTTPSWSRRCGATTCGSRGSSSNGSTAPITSMPWSARSGRDRAGGSASCSTTWSTGRRRPGSPRRSTTPTCWSPATRSSTSGRRSSRRCSASGPGRRFPGARTGRPASWPA